MKTKYLSVFIPALLLSAAAFLAGCAGGGDLNCRTAGAISEVGNRIRAINSRIDATAVSLDAMTSADAAGLKKAFAVYSEDINKLDSEVRLALERLEVMHLQSKEYFAELERQGNSFTNPSVRELSRERLDKLAVIYARVPAASAGIQAAYNVYLADLEKIRVALYGDLTPGGVKAIAPAAGKAKVDLEALRLALQPVVPALDEIRVELFQKK